MDAEHLLTSVLDQIEAREARLLAWGIVDGAFSQQEISDLIDSQIDAALSNGLDKIPDADVVLNALLARHWITEVAQAGNIVAYRSRMAETVRLLQRLRQLLPRHAGPTGWQQAAGLVADFRFLRRCRRYPARNIDPEQALALIGEVTQSPTVRHAAQVLVQDLRLSGFQVRAAQRILGGIESGTELATIVCAGTGSGKTLAFYLPTLASIYRHVLADPTPWVKAIALYPRIELLKDQLREVLQRIRRLQANLGNPSNVSFRVGALFGDLPSSTQYCNWPKVGQNRKCSILACLQCGGDYHWQAHDFNQQRERLVCAGCGDVLEGSLFPLTRQSLKNRAPDVLFTTTEMLNQRLADSSLRHLFGIGSGTHRPPELVLMDEVHTYEGKHGAQVAYLMRRWQRLAGQPLRFVGLSATLRDAARFFASLTGCRGSLVDEVSPRSDEMESEGAEYMIALRGDPVSRKALLSTTIQTTMLLQRCLDPRINPPSQGLFGQRTFVFTDNLDVINRLYFDLLNAEGCRSNGAPDMIRAPDGGLAVLRNPGPSLQRYANGQDWRFCHGLQHPLRLAVRRVSSQDRGVDAEADVLVATAVLEVGFDDPRVGAVIQHKAPRSMAGFLQRKGRAGRTRGMRPWTVVVLSDYGRDRMAYQNYDLLFDPELPVRTLPLENRYITRMQAVYATLDYLSLKLQGVPDGSVWSDLCGSHNIKEQRRMALISLLGSILETEAGTRDLSGYLQRALGLSGEETSTLMWEYPRPLLTTVLPTALRRLASNWHAGGQEGLDYRVNNNPLPDFIPGTLFADLNLAEVAFDLPEPDRQPVDAFNRQAMPVYAALREFAPGRVSRRYGIEHGGVRHWIAPSAEIQANPGMGGGTFNIEIDTIGTHVPLGDFLIRRDGQSLALPVYRPVRLQPQRPPNNIQDSSNARLKWHSQIVATTEPAWLTPPAKSLWTRVVARVGFFTHSRHAPVEIRRFTVGASAEIGMGQTKVRVDTGFQHNQQAAGLGARFSADGVLFQIQMPSNLHEHCPGDEGKWRALRTARFIDEAWRGHHLAVVENPFMREWLAQVYLSALTHEAIQSQSNLADAGAALQEGRAKIPLTEVLTRLFQTQVIEEEGDEGSEDGMAPDRLHHDLAACLQNPDVLEELHDFGALLWEPVDAGWEPWLQGVYHATLAAALLRSVTDLCPNIDSQDLIVDLDRGPASISQDVGFNPEVGEVWLTENGPGGNGLIEEFMRCYAEDPRRFFATVRSNLGMGEFEVIDHQLRAMANLLAENEGISEIPERVQAYREAASHGEMAQSFRQLRRALMQQGFAPFHGFMVALGNRILRSGSGPHTDQYIARVLSQWQSEEARLGIEIDLRIMAYYLAQFADMDNVVAGIVGNAGGADPTPWRIGAIYGLLWPRGRAVRQPTLQMWNPYTELPMIERLLVVDTLGDDRCCISVLDNDWLTRTADVLASGKLVTLTCPDTDRNRLAAALNTLVTNPVESGYLHAYARLQGIRQAQSIMEADIELVEAVQ